jgi:hypothetical protein
VNGSRREAATAGLSKPPATASVRARKSRRSSPGATRLQNGTRSVAISLAFSMSRALRAVVSSPIAQRGEALARMTNVRARGQSTTAARWYQRSTVFPQLPMYPSCSDAKGSSSTDGFV